MATISARTATTFPPRTTEGGSLFKNRRASIEASNALSPSELRVAAPRAPMPTAGFLFREAREDPRLSCSSNWAPCG